MDRYMSELVARTGTSSPALPRRFPPHCRIRNDKLSSHSTNWDALDLMSLRRIMGLYSIHKYKRGIVLWLIS
ncbi:unnamed protein product [Camellia sinensis]